MSPSSSLLSSWKLFWFAPRHPLGLHVLRVFFGILVLIWLFPFSGYLNDFFGFEGWFDRAAFLEASTTAPELVDNQSWSLLYLVADKPALLSAFYWCSLGIVLLFTLGFFTRITSVLTWLIVVSFSANPLIEVDTDVFFRMIAFYLMLGYLFLDWMRSDLPVVKKWLSPTQHWLGQMFRAGEGDHRSSAVTVALRLLQIHFTLAIVIMGLHKLQMAEWWAGVAFWYPMHTPSRASVEVINELRQRWESYLIFISLAAYVVLGWQIFLPTFAWRPGFCRLILLGGAIVGCIGLMIIYPIPLMGPVFLLLCLSYLTEEEWFLVFSPLRGLVKR